MNVDLRVIPSSPISAIPSVEVKSLSEETIQDVTQQIFKGNGFVDVLNTLRLAVMQMSDAKEDNKKNKHVVNSLKTICETILTANADDKRFSVIPDEVMRLITRNGKKGFNRSSYEKLVLSDQINAINQGKLKLSDCTIGLNWRIYGSAEMNWLVEHPARHNLTYLNACHCSFDNIEFKRAVDNCPNIQYLVLKRTPVTGDALRLLKYLPHLKSLDLTLCVKLAPDSLENLTAVSKLTSLNISWCKQFLPGSLVHLTNCQGLRYLNVANCPQFGSNSLQLLAARFESNKLEIVTVSPTIAEINEGERSLQDRFSHLSASDVVEWIVSNPEGKNLLVANFSKFYGFDNACLEKLTKHCPNLQHLNVSDTQISCDALKSLKNTPQLISLDISLCRALGPNALEDFELLDLKSLKIAWCKQLNPNSLKHIKKMPHLEVLDIHRCEQLEAHCLQYLQWTPNLIELNIAYCTNLSPHSLKYLKFTPNLQLFNLKYCGQLLI